MMFAMPASADRFCDEGEANCILQAAWGAALLLPEEKKERLKPVFVDLAEQAGGAELRETWVRKLSLSDLPIKPATQYEDFGWRLAEGVIEEHGVDGLIRFARDKTPPLSFGGSDALLSAGKRLYVSQPEVGEQLNDALFQLASSASDFVRPDLINAAAELAMYRCDKVRFERAVARSNSPSNMRYRLWRARIIGGASELTAAIRDEADEEDTRHVRQVLSGYRAIAELGYCDAPKP